MSINNLKSLYTDIMLSEKVSRLSLMKYARDLGPEGEAELKKIYAGNPEAKLKREFISSINLEELVNDYIKIKENPKDDQIIMLIMTLENMAKTIAESKKTKEKSK